MEGDGKAVRPRVLHLINDLDRGGAEMALCRLVTHPRMRERVEPTVVCLGPEGALAERLRAAGVAVHVIGLRGLLDLPGALWRLHRLIGGVRPDIVQTWLYLSDLLGSLLCRARGIPVVWGVRTTALGAGNSPMTRVVRWLCARLSGVLPAAIVFAAEAARQAHARVGYRMAASHVVRNGVETPSDTWLADSRRAMRGELGLTDEQVVIGWVGRNNPDKDVPTFLEALARVLPRHPEARVVMVGRGLGADRTAHFARAVGAEGMARLLLVGERTDVEACYPAFDLFVLSSRTEAFPNVLAEAMAAGVACVSTDVGDARWVLGDGGLMVPRGDPAAMAEALDALLSRPGQRAAMGGRARERALASHGMDRWANAFLGLYRKVAARR